MRLTALVLLGGLLTGSSAIGEWGPEIVSGGVPVPAPSDCVEEPPGPCLRRLGLPDGAVAFSLALGDLAGQAVATGFTELGRVDLAHLAVPYAPWEAPMMVNGADGIVDPMRWPVDLARDFADRTSRRLLRHFPNATAWGPGVVGHRALPGGGQRFVLARPLTDGCRACPVIGTAIEFADFSPDGRLGGRRPVGLIDTRAGRDATDGWSAEALRSKRPLMQYRLNLLGYDAGEMDGIAGPGTRAALMTFQADHCLPPTGQITRKTAKALAASDGFSSPCAGAALPHGIGPLNPLRDGLYVTDPVYCDTARVPYETSHLTMVRIDGRNVVWGWEDGCEVTRTDTGRGHTLFRGTCHVGPRQFEHRWKWNVRAPDRFRQVSGLFEGTNKELLTRCEDAR